jgi:hypothetical protein
MSDSFGYTPGAAPTEQGAADRIGGLLFQRIKVTFGPDGTALDVSAADPLPVTLSTAQAADLAMLAGATALEDDPTAGGERGMVMLAMRRDSDTSTAGDGDFTMLKMDEAGRLKVASQPGLAPITTGSITASAQTVAVNVARQSNLMAHMVATSLVGHNATFEGSIDSTNGTDGAWFAIQAVRTNANTIELTTGVLAATPAYGWELSVNGLAWARVRATAHTSGTALWKFQPAPFATEPIPAAQVSGTQPVSGTVTANIGTGALAAGTNLIGDVGLSARQNAGGAATIHHFVSAATTNALNIKASAGRVLGWSLANTTASWRYLKLHNSAGVPTAGASVALTIAIPPNGLSQGAHPVGIGFNVGIGRTCVTGGADADATATAAGDVVGDIFFA